MLYTPSHAELGQHPKTRKLARLLGVSIPTAVGHLHLLWHFALKYAPDGDLSRFDNDEIADGVMWEGDSDQLLRALWSAGWTECPDDGGSPVIHDWHEHGGKAIKQKEGAAERQQRWRDRNKTTTQQAPNDDETVTSPLRNAKKTHRNALEDKRGEEKRREESEYVADATTHNIPPVEKAPTPIKRGKPKTQLPADFAITDGMLAWARRSAPDVNVALQTERFENYWRGEGATKSDWVATWRNWLLGEQDKLDKNGRRFMTQAEMNAPAPGKFVGA